MAKPSEDPNLRLHNKTTDFPLTDFGFPSEFPYEFDSFGFEPLSSPPVESVAGSTETESSDEEDFFAGLTRRLSQATVHETRNQQLRSVPITNSDKAEKEKTTRVLAGSPQSILSGIGSWSGRSAGSGDGSPEGGCSRVPSPFSAANDAWEVISAAAGQVARLKMHAGNGNSAALASKLDFQTRGVLGGLPHATASFGNLPQIYNHAPQGPYNTVMQEHLFKQQCSSVLGRQGNSNKPNSWSSQQLHGGVKCVRVLPQPSAWHNLHQVKHQHQQNQQHHNITHAGSGSRPVLQTGSGVGGIKRGCSGTGVFLPRQYGAPLPEPRKKSGCAPVVVPAKVMHGLNLNNDDLNVNTTTSTQQQRFSRAFADYDALLARRNALVIQQQRLAAVLRREEIATYEASLPQEWTY
ncbi:hypothetical protein PIB30_055151 [Stylosanthes scabra]|uniref:Uncharacterized protein n=1 Tax=Stylosanthes scabra TaxID=79078 RepID=A0ABU6RIX8_9FABA|nr:hypothetical protein [Stylosanthes scabra]